MKNRIFLVLLVLMLAFSVSVTSCGAPSEEEEEEEEFGPGDCIDFEDLEPGPLYRAGDTINTRGVVITVEQFQGPGGYAEVVVDRELTSGSGRRELFVDNVNLRFDFGGTYELVYILFGDYGDALYLEINGHPATVTDFSDIVTPHNGVDVRIQNQGNGKGRLKLAGTRAANITSLAIGGQELAIDEVCVYTPAESTPTCCDFNLLTVGSQYNVGDTFTDNDCQVVIAVEGFQWWNSQWTYDGYARVDDEGLAGMPTPGRDILVNNVNLNFTFSEPPTTLSLRYGEYGGNINIEVNGDFRNVDDFSDVISPVGNVTVTTGNHGDGKGVISFSGTIDSLAIGGQELWIDHVCRFERIEPSPETTLDHFRVYGLDPATGPSGWPYVGETVELEDQFGSLTATVGWGTALANPVEKTYNGVTASISNKDGHYMAYGLEGVEPHWWRVTVNNQFGTQELTVAGPIGLSVATQKLYPGEHDPPEGLDCFLAYEVIDPPTVEVVVDLRDQFGDEPGVLVTQAKGFANPVRVTHDGQVMEIVNQDAHQVSYWTLAEGAATKQHEVDASNQFGQYHLTVLQGEEGILSVPSEKIEWEPIEPPLDHFRCYNFYGEMPNPGEAVELTDQFGTFTATVGLGTTFCNPVEKAVNQIAAWEWMPISHPDYHLVVHILEDVQPSGEWVVEVNNQFGEQELTISGPVGLAVPTRKEPHGEPVGLDYFLVYDVNEGAAVDVIVDLIDEFGGGDNNFQVIGPLGFLAPVRITHDGTVTRIVSPDDHLVLYKAENYDAIPEVHTVEISNPFGQWSLDVYQGDVAYLLVPSEKINWYAE